MLVEYCIYTRDMTSEHIQGLRDLDIHLDIHANRTRFWLDSSHKEHYLYYLQYSDVLYRVKDVTESYYARVDYASDADKSC